jgi:dienelactone hydrolase
MAPTSRTKKSSAAKSPASAKKPKDITMVVSYNHDDEACAHAAIAVGFSCGAIARLLHLHCLQVLI